MHKHLEGHQFFMGFLVALWPSKEAIGWLEREVILKPNDPIPHAYLAELYFKSNKIECAKAEALKALLWLKPSQGWVQEIKEILES